MLLNVGVPSVDGDKEDGDDDEHFAKLQHHVEVGIDTKSKDQEWVLDKLIFSFGHLEAHIGHESLSQSVLEVWLLGLFQAPFQLGHNVV